MNTFIINNDILYGTGNNIFGQIGPNPRPDIYDMQPIKLEACPKQVICGHIVQSCDYGNHTCTIVLTTANDIYVLGQKNIPTILATDHIAKTVSCGYDHIIIQLYNSDYVYVLGENVFGQLGLGLPHNAYLNILHSLKFANIVTQVSCGGYHSIVSTNDDCVYAFGQNTYGQLGLGHYHNEALPQLVSIIPDIIQIACGKYYTMILTSTSKVYVFGCNEYGQLGLGDYIYRYRPCLLDTYLSNIIAQIALGDDHTIILTNTGQVYTWGDNRYGQLGLGCNMHKNKNTPHLVKINDIITQVACGEKHTLLLSNSNHVYSFGYNRYGQLGRNYIDQNKPVLIPLTKATLLMGNTTPIRIDWTPENHFSFSDQFRHSIMMFMLINRHVFPKVIRIPKYVCFKIINQCF